MTKTCVWYSENAHGREASAPHAINAAPARRASVAVKGRPPRSGAEERVTDDVTKLRGEDVTRPVATRVDLVGDPRREAGRRLVDEQERRLRHQLFREGEYSRLAAAQRGGPAP